MPVLNPFTLTNDYTIRLDCPYLGDDDDVQFKIITNDKELIMQKVMAPLFGRPNIPGYTVFQIELPLSAAKWLVDCIENKLWKSAAFFFEIYLISAENKTKTPGIGQP